LLLRQRAFSQARWFGLMGEIWDGGFYAFGTKFKYFLTASAEERAQRRLQQLAAKKRCEAG